jgi:hypothetical protein
VHKVRPALKVQRVLQELKAQPGLRDLLVLKAQQGLKVLSGQRVLRVQMVNKVLSVRKVQPVLKVSPVLKVLLAHKVLLVLLVLMEPTERMVRTHWLKLRPSPLPITAPMVA